MDPQSVDSLIANNRYNIEILPQLETYVKHQVQNQAYHFEANQTILKFYQFHPEKTQKMIVGQILCKALMNLPHYDFMMSLYLLPEKLHEEEPVKTLAGLAHFLETCRFAEFWVEAKTCRELLNTIPGFDDSIRGFIIGVVTSTYQTIPKDFLAQTLNMSGTDLDALITARGWSQTADSVSFPKVDDSVKMKKMLGGEAIKFEDLARILGSLTR